jgi:hypothetical protein
MSKPAAPPEQLSLFAALVGGLVRRPLRGPAARDEIAEQLLGPAGFELADHVDQVLVGVEAEQQAAVDEGEGRGEALTTASRPGEEEVATRHSKGTDSPLDAPAVDLEAPVGEAAPEECALVDRVGRGAPERGLGQQPRVELVDPSVEGVEQRQRAPPPLLTSRPGIEPALLAVVFDRVQVCEDLERDRGPPIFGQQRRVKLAPDVHAAAKSALG